MKSNSITSSPCAFLPDGVLNLCCIYFPHSNKDSSFLLVPVSSYFWHPCYTGGFKEFSSVFFFFVPNHPGNFRARNGSSPFLHKHWKEKKYLVTTQDRMGKLLYDYHHVLKGLNSTVCPAEENTPGQKGFLHLHTS